MSIEKTTETVTRKGVMDVPAAKIVYEKPVGPKKVKVKDLPRGTTFRFADIIEAIYYVTDGGFVGMGGGENGRFYKTENFGQWEVVVLDTTITVRDA